jgi:hypothetical protein
MRFSGKKIIIKIFFKNLFTRFFSITAEYTYRLSVSYQLWTLMTIALLTSNNEVLAEQIPSLTKSLDTIPVQLIANRSSVIALSKQTSLPSSSQSTNDNSVCDSPQPTITFNPQTIFDESEDGIIFFHRWINAIHIDTKIFTLKNESYFFTKKCDKTPTDMAELERYLRGKKYLRDAEVTSDTYIKDIKITTWDNWTLMPTLSFGRKGGINTFSVGIKDRNLLGLGIDAEIASYQNLQRSGYKVHVSSPLFQKQNTELNLKFADNDDGEQKSLFVHKAFASFDTKSSYKVGFNEELRNDTIFQNGENQRIFTHTINYKEINYAWLDSHHSNHLLRYRLGLTQNKHTFSALSPEDLLGLSTTTLTETLPLDRDLLYPWIALQFIEKDFKKLTNINLISQIEDFNQGWQLDTQLGLGNGSNENSAWLLWKLHLQKGFNIHNNALLLFEFSIANDIYQDRDSRLIAKLNGEYFYRLTKQWGFYLSNTYVLSKNQYSDQPITVGGNSGVRGFPLQYQHGKNSVKLTSEIRYYPEINLFKLFDLAGVAFTDLARTIGDSVVENVENGWLSSVGLGLRVHTPHSGGNNSVIHLDFAFPQSENPQINNFEIRVQAKKSF